MDNTIYGEVPYVSLFGLIYKPTLELKFIDVENVGMPIQLNPDSFIAWLKEIGEEVFEDYGESVCTMCEYAILWVSHQLYFNNVSVERLKICYGDFGLTEHYWLLLDDEYFVDLTLAQFIQDAPKIAVTLKKDSVSETTYKNYIIMTYKEYINTKI